MIMKKLNLILCIAMLAVIMSVKAQTPTEGEAIDMGVSVTWRAYDLGSSEIAKKGSLYAYGCMDQGVPFKNYYKFYNKTMWSVIFPKNDFAGDAEYDAAAAQTNGLWQIPTSAQWEELINNCTVEWTTVEGTEGALLTSKTNGNSIFLPADANKSQCQYYASDNKGSNAYIAEISANSAYVTSTASPWKGLAIRPVSAASDKPELKALALSGESDKMFANTTMQVSVTATPADASVLGGTWSSSDESVATVTDGLVTAVGAGTADITLTCGNVSGSMTVNVTAVETVGEAFVDLGVSVLWASGYYGMKSADATAPTYSYGKVSRSLSGTSTYWFGFEDRVLPKAIRGDIRYDAIAKNSNGEQRMPSKGETDELLDAVCVMKATQNGVSGYLLTSRINGKSIFLSEQETQGFYIGDCSEDQMKAYRCSVNKDKFVVGTSTTPEYDLPLLAVKLKEETPALKEFVIAPTEATVYEENKVRLTFETSPLGVDITDAVWASSDENIAVVDEYGNVTGVGEGDAVISLTLGDVKSSVTVKVVKFPDVAADGLVDMGLSVKWMSCNLGADNPWELGDRYQWGGLTPVEGDGSADGWQSPETNEISATVYDAIYTNTNNTRCLPTRTEFQELVNNCDREWVTYHGVKGNLVTSRKNGAALFFPGIPDYKKEDVTPQAMGGYFSGSKSNGPSGRVYVCQTGNGVFYQVEMNGYYALPLRGVESSLTGIFQPVAEGVITVYDVKGFRVAQGRQCEVLHQLPEGLYIINDGKDSKKIVK